MELVNELYAFCGRTECLRIGAQPGEPARVGTVERAETVAVVKEAVEALVRMISPFTPHMAEELWEMLGHKDGVVAAGWPTFDEAVAKADEIVVPVQVNGKVRARLTVPAGTSEERLREIALADPAIVKHLEGKTVEEGPGRARWPSGQHRGKLGTAPAAAASERSETSRRAWGWGPTRKKQRQSRTFKQ